MYYLYYNISYIDLLYLMDVWEIYIYGYTLDILYVSHYIHPLDVLHPFNWMYYNYIILFPYYYIPMIRSGVPAHGRGKELDDV